MGKHRDAVKRPEVVRALITVGVVVAVAALGFVAATGVRALQAYRSIERESYASASEVRAQIDNRTQEQKTEALQEAARDAQPPLLDKDLLALVVAERNNRVPVITPFELPEATSPVLPDGMFASYLLVGQEGPRADAMLLILLPSDGSAPIIVSLPRDLYVNNPCIDDYARLNTGLGGCKGVAGGAELLALMVKDYTGIEVDHFARIDFSGFADIIDALGGVDVCVDNPVRDAKAQLDLPAGCTHVNGTQALAWVRTRHTEEYVDGEWQRVPGASDLTREQHQQEMLFKIAGRLASFSSLSAFSSVANQVASVVHLDSHFAFGDAVSLAWSFRGITASQVRTVHISVENYVTPAGAWVLLPKETFNAELAKVYPAAAR
jgi:LCP family protein required for cell wall assembly